MNIALLSGSFLPTLGGAEVVVDSLAKEFDCSGLIFKTGDISKYSDSEKELFY